MPHRNGAELGAAGLSILRRLLQQLLQLLAPPLALDDGGLGLGPRDDRWRSRPGPAPLTFR